MKILITKSDGTPTKSKVHALQFLAKKGIEKDCLIEEKGKFFYEDGEVGAEQITKAEAYKPTTITKALDTIFNEEPKIDIPEVEKTIVKELVSTDLNWETPVLAENNENTKLSFKKNIQVIAELKAKHPAGQNAMRPYNAVEIKIGTANAIVLPLDVASMLFEVHQPEGV